MGKFDKTPLAYVTAGGHAEIVRLLEGTNVAFPLWSSAEHWAAMALRWRRCCMS